MTQWQADFYRRPLQNDQGNPLWELLLCDAATQFRFQVFCPQPEVNSAWLTRQLSHAIASVGDRPSVIQVFRPQCLSLLELACQPLGIAVQPTRRTPALKQWLRERVEEYPRLVGYTGQPYDPITLEQPPPLPLPESIWGDRWQFAAIAAGDLDMTLRHRPIPVLSMPAELEPINLGLASTTPIPGVVIQGGRQSMRLARWLQSITPVALHYIPGEPDGVILDAGLVDRWILTTFDDAEMQSAGRTFQTRLSQSDRLHFLLVQPDDSGMTYSGFWLLRSIDSPQC